MAYAGVATRIGLSVTVGYPQQDRSSVVSCDGQDERARSLVKAAKRLNAHHIETLLLEAALTRDVSARKVLYEKVLELDPVNEVAHANLKQMP